MNTTEINTSIINGYLKLLENLSPDNKLDLISKLSALVKIDLSKNKSAFKKAFGALDTDQTAEEMITDIRNSRVSTRQIETF